MRNPSQALLLAVLMTSLILPPVLPAAASGRAAPSSARHILLVGDSLSIGLGQQLEAVFAGHPGIRFDHLGKVSSGLANPAFFDWDANLTAQVALHHPDLVLIMVGANDDKPLPTPGGTKAAFGTREWDAAYAARLAKLHAIVKAENPAAAVYYIGVPVMADPAFNTEMIHVSALIAKTAQSLSDAAFIDVRDVLADPSGAFAPVAKTADGGVVKLRADDGVHISGTGSRLLAARCLQAVSDVAGLPKRELLASLDDEDKDIHPVASAAGMPVRVAEMHQGRAPASPAKAQVPAATVAQAKAAPVQLARAAARPAPVAPSAPAGQAYTVADGDTLWGVAKRLGVSPESLAEANPGVDPHRMSIGQSLAVPAGANPLAVAQAETPRAAAAGHGYIVADGDNFWSVARRYNVTVAALTEANPGVEPTRLRIGQELAIPGAGQPAAPTHLAASQEGGNSYVVADGDNFWAIAHRLGLDVAQLTKVNAAVDPQKLQPGQVLALPGVTRADGGSDQPAPRRPVRPAPAAFSDAALYPVAKGDTLWGLARRFGVDFETLLSVNGEIDPARLHVGQLVTIPSGQTVASAESLVFPVSAGDTLGTIARRFDVSVDALIAANPGIDPLRLHEGQSLRVPSSLAAVAASGAPNQAPAKAAIPVANPAEATPAGSSPSAMGETPRAHTVSLGDTVWELSRRYGISVERILSENSGIDPLHLQVGQTVRLPGSAVAMAAR